jgi:hypothetical protein
LEDVPYRDLEEFAYYTAADMLRAMKSFAQEAIDGATDAMTRLGDADAEALVSTNAIESLKRVVDAREQAYSRPERGGLNQGAQYFLRNLPWLSVDLNKICAKYRYGLVFPLPIGHSMATHVFVDYVWEDDDRIEDGLPLFIHSRKLCDSRVVPLYFVDNKPHMSGAHSIGWPVNLSRNDWQRRGVQQDFLYVGSCMDSAYMEDPESRKQYWLFPSEFTTQLTQKLKRKVASKDKPAHFFAREGIEEDLLPLPKLEQGRRPTAVTTDSGFLSDRYKHVNPARYIVDGEEELYHHMCAVIQGSGLISINSPQSLTPNTPFTAERHYTTLQKVLQATWDFGGKCLPSAVFAFLLTL